MKRPVYKSCAKVNIFLKIVGFVDGYHQIVSRFVRVEELFDAMWFDKGNGKEFEIIGEFDCQKEDNTIHKAYEALLKYTASKEVNEFCKLNKVVVYKKIPSQAGLGGGSSNAATFLLMMNDHLKLRLDSDELIEIAKSVGADVPFFVSGFKSANVTGFGEKIEEFNDDIPSLEFLTPDIKCSTAHVFKTFRKKFADTMNANKLMSKELINLTSKEILNKYQPQKLNDLLPAALKADAMLYEFVKPEWFFSGSGSTFFKVKNS